MSSFIVPDFISGDIGLTQYLVRIQQFPILSQQEEYDLAVRWKTTGDVSAAHKLVTSYLRLVAKIAQNYTGYGLPISDLIAEGNIGLMQAVKKFDPERGFRLSTYAIWWIKAIIQEYILRSWSLVKLGTTTAQKKLFFNLRRLKTHLGIFDDRDFSEEKISTISKTLNVTPSDVLNMNARLETGEVSLQAPVHYDGEKDFQEILPSLETSQEDRLIANETSHNRTRLLQKAMLSLSEREKKILVSRQLNVPASTLEELSQSYKISRERVRQIEKRALEKLQQYVQNAAIT